MQVLGGVSGGGHRTAAEGHIMFIGNVCLLINTLASAVYYLGAKKLVQVEAFCFNPQYFQTTQHCHLIFQAGNETTGSCHLHFDPRHSDCYVSCFSR